MINKIDLQQVKVPAYLRLDGLANELNKNFETLATAIESVDANGVITVPGPQGDKGEQGEQGLRGPAGQDGKDGKDGANGADGLPGVDGKDGEPGVQGIPGEPGAQGIQGPVGPAGAQGPAGPQGAGPVAYKGVCVDDGVEVTLDSIVVRLNPGSPRSLQFRLTTGTLSVHISGIIYWTNNGTGNIGANYWQSKTLTTAWQQPFGWDFPWANDNAVYNLQDMTNKRFYRITLSIGNGYKNNFIVMERLV